MLELHGKRQRFHRSVHSRGSRNVELHLSHFKSGRSNFHGKNASKHVVLYTEIELIVINSMTGEGL